MNDQADLRSWPAALTMLVCFNLWSHYESPYQRARTGSLFRTNWEKIEKIPPSGHFLKTLHLSSEFICLNPNIHILPVGIAEQVAF